MQAFKALSYIAWLNLLLGLLAIVLFFMNAGVISLLLIVAMQAVNWFVLFQVIIPVLQNLIAIRDKRE